MLHAWLCQGTNFQVGEVVVSLTGLHPWPGHIEPDNREPVLCEELDVLLAEGELRVKGAIARVVGEALEHLEEYKESVKLLHSSTPVNGHSWVKDIYDIKDYFHGPER